ncbi:hypothetical protein BEN49_02785 [Hymenobacter coccineus]|uniref:Ricin B lectin domain-containing protein n=1 Tax=Hymenobacter coccineus TaxID=1908235 RepID=A0A1G1SU24_9BACT|nr:hypothetical protein BEN49_02785 [Hymenobacter coccineus]
MASSGVPADAAVDPGNADAAFNAFNNSFLVNTGGQTYYKSSVNDGTPEHTYLAALDIMLAEDVYERTGRAAHKDLVNNLCNTFLQKLPTPWGYNGWNDDLGWYSMAMVRGYQMTGTSKFLVAARNGFDEAFARGWDTRWNGGGIWEQQIEMVPSGEKINKEALSNNTLGIVACLIYQSNHDKWYLDQATQIYDWMRRTIYNTSTGQVYTGVFQNGNIDYGEAVYNQGAFVDYANLLYQITGNTSYYDDAKRSIDYVKNSPTLTTGGVISTDDGGHDTWADAFARGLGHFVRDNRQWDAYYPWMAQNAGALWANRRTDQNLTWNAWARPTPNDNNMKSIKFVSAVAWLQFTPATKPGAIAGVHTIVSKLGNMAVDNAGLTDNGTGIVQWGAGNNQNQKWNFTQNEDGSWNIISQQSWQALDVPNSNVVNGTQPVQWPSNRAANQRWWVEAQADGTYRIWSQVVGGGSLDNGSTTTNGDKLLLWGWGGGDQQHWQLR